MNDEDIYDLALTTWGYDLQMDVAIEELSELIKAILKHRRDPSIHKAIDIAEELGDVEIMCKQLEIAMLQKYPEFTQWKLESKQTKLHRVRSMLNEHKNL